MKSKVVLMQSYYQDKNPERQKEIDYCHKNNIDNPFFDHHISYQVFRPTFNHLFYHTKDFPDALIIIANSDITFNDTIQKILNINWRKSLCLALSRWDMKKNFQQIESLEHHAHADSQDVWIFKGTVPVIQGADFFMGVPGCDNVLAHLLMLEGYQLYNPSKDIQCIHHHQSHERAYDRKPDGEIYRLPPPYHLVQPCNLSDVK